MFKLIGKKKKQFNAQNVSLSGPMLFQESLCRRAVSTSGVYSSASQEEILKEQGPIHPYRLVESQIAGITELIKQVLLS